jgi:hypothetical protein
MDEDPYYVSRSMPRFWRWYLRIFPVALLAAVTLSIWRNSDWYLVTPISVIAALLLHLHYFVRCPRCSRRLRPRIVKERWRSGYRRYFYDCPACRVTWDSHYVEQPESL